jgi:hypothetical protein
MVRTCTLLAAALVWNNIYSRQPVRFGLGSWRLWCIKIFYHPPLKFTDHNFQRVRSADGHPGDFPTYLVLRNALQILRSLKVPRWRKTDLSIISNDYIGTSIGVHSLMTQLMLDEMKMKWNSPTRRNNRWTRVSRTTMTGSRVVGCNVVRKVINVLRSFHLLPILKGEFFEIISRRKWKTVRVWGYSWCQGRSRRVNLQQWICWHCWLGHMTEPRGCLGHEQTHHESYRVNRKTLWWLLSSFIIACRM